MSVATPSAPVPARRPNHQPQLILPDLPELNAGLSPADPPVDDDAAYDTQDAAQSLIQPSISPVATRLASPETPAAEKAAAMWDMLIDDILRNPLPDVTLGYGETSETMMPEPATKETTLNAPTLAQLDGAHTPTSPTSQSSRKRASTVGNDALKRLSKVLPSISIPSGLVSSIPTPSFFSSKNESSNVSTDTEQPAFQETGTGSNQGIQRRRYPDGQPPRPSGGSNEAPKLQRSTSAESVLYHSMSRVSSYGDDGRFSDVRRMGNARFKAIMDSFDRPTFNKPAFKMPQLPNIMGAAPWKISLNSTDAAVSSHTNQRSIASTPKDGTASLDAVLESLFGDVVVLGGYRGSVLRSAAPPHQQLWVPVKVGLRMRKVDLEVGLDPADEDAMEDRIIATSMLQNVGPVDISRRLLKRMRECPNARAGLLRVHEFAYDWRLSPARSSMKLVRFLERLRCNSGEGEPAGALVVAHSLGGVITRHAVNQRPELFSGVVYAGVPQRCISILGPLRNGDAVLLNQKLLTSHVTFSFRTSFVFLPEDGHCFMSKDGREQFKIDFYDPEDWVRYGLCPSVVPEVNLHPVKTGRLDSALESLKEMSSSISNFDLRGRNSSDGRSGSRANSPPDGAVATEGDGTTARNIAYLARTLAETKQFRAGTRHRADLSAANAYPPTAVMYGKNTPTVSEVRVASRDAMAAFAMGGDLYEDLVFRSGDGVVLAREAMLPEGYAVVAGGRVSTEKGHISILGDLGGVARALEAVLRGREKGIGLGPGRIRGRPVGGGGRDELYELP